MTISFGFHDRPFEVPSPQDLIPQGSSVLLFERNFFACGRLNEPHSQHFVLAFPYLISAQSPRIMIFLRGSFPFFFLVVCGFSP